MAPVAVLTKNAPAQLPPPANRTAVAFTGAEKASSVEGSHALRFSARCETALETPPAAARSSAYCAMLGAPRAPISIKEGKRRRRNMDPLVYTTGAGRR
jgi:hypothetical protein